MEVAEIKNDLIERIEHAKPEQLKQLYGLVLNYFGSQIVIGGEGNLTEYKKERLHKSLEQENANLGIPFDEVVQKYVKIRIEWLRELFIYLKGASLRGTKQSLQMQIDHAYSPPVSLRIASYLVMKIIT